MRTRRAVRETVRVSPRTHRPAEAVVQRRNFTSRLFNAPAGETTVRETPLADHDRPEKASDG